MKGRVQSMQAQSQSPIRVMHVMGHMSGGGVEATVMNHYRHIDRDHIQFDFVVDDDSTCVPKKEIEELGGRIFVVPRYTKIFDYLRACEQLFLEEKPLIVHSNINALSVFPLRAAKKAGVPIRIAHSHSTANPSERAKTLVKNILRPFSKVYPTHLAACSEHSAQWLFGNKSVISGKVNLINNAIDLDKFLFNKDTRKALRNSLKVAENQLVIGQVGRICYQKNQLFTIEVFAEVLKRRPNALLIFVGDGEMREAAQAKAHTLGVEKSVRFLGQRNDVSDWYQAFDILAFPSRYEGLGMAAVEAQVADLQVLASHDVPREAAIIPERIQFLDTRDKSLWIQLLSETRVTSLRMNRVHAMKMAGYDITQSSISLCNWYEKLAAQEKAKQSA
jgi:glycosyltransferase involved in cell wall biosynthesis